MRDARDIILRPVLTEKSAAQSERHRKYTFQTRGDANKVEIRRAVEELFNVNVVKVNTLWVRGKRRRLGRFPPGRTARWKKAIVTLQEGQSIQIFQGL